MDVGEVNDYYLCKDILIIEADIDGVNFLKNILSTN